jgi:pimeloyl-ACP methyl ester carboxylesterase
VDVLLLPGTLSSATQLDPLAAALARRADVTVHALDRRGIGRSRSVVVGPVDVAVHVADAVAYLNARGVAGAVVVGISYGGVLALELAARHPSRIVAVMAWEPPYGPVLDAEGQSWFRTVADRTAAAHRTGGSAAAADTFMRLVAGDDAWDGLNPRTRAFLEGEGDGAFADSALRGVDPGGLARIAAPTVVATGGGSRSFYSRIATALVAQVPHVRLVALEGRSHTWPLTDPGGFAAAVVSALADVGVLRDDGPAAPSAGAEGPGCQGRREPTSARAPAPGRAR